MDDDTNIPNPASAKSKAEGERDETGGISNRPLSEEEENQATVPERGESREGAHAGHGGGRRSERHQDDEEDDLIARNSERARATPRRYDHKVV